MKSLQERIIEEYVVRAEQIWQLYNMESASDARKFLYDTSIISAFLERIDILSSLSTIQIHEALERCCYIPDEKERKSTITSALRKAFTK